MLEKSFFQETNEILVDRQLIERKKKPTPLYIDYNLRRNVGKKMKML